jgi:teichuronic acid exporter
MEDFETDQYKFDVYKNFKKQTISGLFWSFIERFGSVLIQFISNIVLARLLSPFEFGLIGMIMVFIAISITFVEGGFSSALIQKKDPTPEDYSTIFFVNIAVAITLFILLFFAAPSVAAFYKQPVLSDLLRVLGLVLILNALSIIQNTKLLKSVEYKQIAKINLSAPILACSLSITAAIFGAGVWSLVIQMLAISFFKTVFLWLNNAWRPVAVFQVKSAKQLVSFGYKLLISGLIDSVYMNMYSLIIGKVFLSVDLGYYTQARKMQDVPVYTLSGVVNQVTFPVFAYLQHDLQKLKNGLKKSLSTLAFLNFPLMIIMIVIAKPLFVLLFTVKWNEAIPYFQILCLSGMFLSSHTVNLNALKAKGRSDIYLLSEIIKKIIGIIALLLSIRWGIIGMIYSIVFTSFVSFFISAYFSAKIVQYGIKEQTLDVLPSFLLSIVAGFAIMFLTSFLNLHNFFLLCVQIISYIAMYLCLAQIFNRKILHMYVSIILERTAGKTK